MPIFDMIFQVVGGVNENGYWFYYHYSIHLEGEEESDPIGRAREIVKRQSRSIGDPTGFPICMSVDMLSPIEGLARMATHELGIPYRLEVRRHHGAGSRGEISTGNTHPSIFEFHRSRFHWLLEEEERDGQRRNQG